MMTALRSCSRRLRRLALPCLMLASLPVAAQARRPAAERTFWTGGSGGFTFAWTDRDLRASVGTRRVWTARTGPEKEARTMSGCTDYEVTVTLLSVVGSVASYEETTSWYCTGAAHPSAYTTYRAVDASRPQAPAKLTDWFPEQEVRAALLADPLVRKALTAARVRTPPARLTALVQTLSEAPSECEYAFSDDLLTRFAFHHLEGGKVAVRLGLSHGCEVMRGRLTQLGILLPIPERLKAPLAQAAAGRQGFLADRGRTIAGDRTTELQLISPK